MYEIIEPNTNLSVDEIQKGMFWWILDWLGRAIERFRTVSNEFNEKWLQFERNHTHRLQHQFYFTTSTAFELSSRKQKQIYFIFTLFSRLLLPLLHKNRRRWRTRWCRRWQTKKVNKAMIWEIEWTKKRKNERKKERNVSVLTQPFRKHLLQCMLIACSVAQLRMFDHELSPHLD